MDTGTPRNRLAFDVTHRRCCRSLCHFPFANPIAPPVRAAPISLRRLDGSVGNLSVHNLFSARGNLPLQDLARHRDWSRNDYAHCRTGEIGRSHSDLFRNARKCMVSLCCW
ncbi:hypothetical protein EV130_10478 [Rhizobium azibense]|uniref:Uncharacterized protein n=1 Tax=Rhizobium azibense TaxID=1136135 RepID=A0A4R3QVK5_9HYPH|nr:hypothetical protein EV130_10478 [Rhizobium azibense]